ncbi:MAG: hypothetical protein JRJ12_12510 [Deltaproteobacteria bacterium]|nr:hypothetical protein [Deltaproteobacteria bacterium]MBW2071788.1 hypothetical protein [Deltaproteobacteria bacterium]
MMSREEFLVGANYWPSRTAMFMWRRFDVALIKEDFARAASLNLSLLRIYLLWEDFQPAPRKVSTLMLDRLVKAAELAADHQLKLTVSLFTGYCSGMVWLPPWMLLASQAEDNLPVFSADKIRHNRPRNPYEEPELIESQIYFIKELTTAIAGHPALLFWDLGNQPGIWSRAPDESAARIWLQALTETLRERAKSVAITLSISLKDLEENPTVDVLAPASHLDFLAVAGLSSSSPWSGGGPDSALAPFIGAITAWLTAKPVLINDFGVSTKPASGNETSLDSDGKGSGIFAVDEEASQFVAEVLSLAAKIGLAGALWHSWSDYHPSVWDWPPLNLNAAERFSGLVRHDGTSKPAAISVQNASREATSGEICRDWLDITAEEFCRDPKNHLSRLHRRFGKYYGLRQ